MTTLTQPSEGSQTELVVPPKPSNRLKKSLIVAAVAAFTVATCVPAIGGIELDIAAIIKNWQNGANKIAQLMTPNWEF